MGLFIKVHETWVDGVSRERWVNVNLITDMARFKSDKYCTDANAEINMVSMDGENNPVVFHVTETVEEILEKINGCRSNN